MVSTANSLEPESRTTNSSRCTTAPNSPSFHSRKIIECSQESFQKESGYCPQARKNCLTQATQVACDSKKSERQCIASLNSNPTFSMYSKHPNNCLLKEAPDSRLPSNRYLKLLSILVIIGVLCLRDHDGRKYGLLIDLIEGVKMKFITKRSK